MDLPSSIAVIGLLAFLLWAAATTYLNGFYSYFALNLQEVGLNHLEVLERTSSILGLAALLAFVPLAISLAVLWLYPDSTPDPPRKRPGRVWRIGGKVVAGAVLVTLMVGSVWSISMLNEMGRQDADHVVTVPRAYYFVSVPQRFFGAKTVVAYAQWVGPPEQSPLETRSPRTGAVVGDSYKKGVTYNLVRILAQTGEVTTFFNVADCDVHRVPTASIALRNQPVLYYDDDDQDDTSPIPTCPSRIRN